MGNRLWIRLWLAFGLVLAVALIMAAWVGHRSATRAFHLYVEGGASLQQPRIQNVLRRYYETRGGWTGVDLVIESLGSTGNGPIVLYDPTGRPIADSDPTREMPPIDPGDELVTLPIRDRSGAAVGQVRVPAPLGRVVTRDRRSQEYIATIGRSLVLGALAGGALALVASLIVSRRIVAPVEALTRAARRIGAGDLDQRVEASGEAEVGELARAFNTMAEQLARDQRLRRQLVADLAHELRSPLANVCGYLEALRDGVLEPRPEVVASIHEEALMLQRLIEDLQELSLAESGQLRLERRAVDVPSLLDRAAAAAQAAALAKAITLRIEPPEAALPAAWIDEQRIAQVLRNLLANAITYTPPGGTVRLIARTVEQPKGSQIAISVADTGPGIDPADLPYLFERFYRTDRSRDRATGGVGLGLTIARQLVLAHGGTIEVQSAPGQGATVTFTVPAAVDRPAAFDSRVQPNEHPPAMARP